MSKSKLYVFAKNTDANFSIRGYNYQTLKTLETWIENLLNKEDEEIYCDFEDDIFQKSKINQIVKFRQLKLFSTNFSFKSEEIEKCISHFFMLHVKTDYLSKDKEFVFETNAAIASKYLNNDAELLRNWVENQNNLTGELLKQCSEKVKEIVGKYISERTNELKGKLDETLLEEALSIFKNIKDEDWTEFTRKIKWKFSNKLPEDEFIDTIINVENLILKLPFPIDKESLQSVFGILYKEVSLKASNHNPDDRRLTITELEKLILNAGDEEDKWYSAVFDKWKDIKGLDVFNLGEFHEILNAARYCRRNKYLSGHNDTWIDILNIFIIKLSIKKDFQNKAIYEIIWLSFSIYDIHERPAGDLTGYEELIRYYFKDFGEFKNATDLEDAQNILHLIFSAITFSKVIISKKELNNWFRKLFFELNKLLKSDLNTSEKCHVLELLGTFKLFSNQGPRKHRDSKSIIGYFDQILSIIDTADYYHATRLSDSINKYIKLFIEIDPEENSEMIRELESFSEKLDVVVYKREGEYKSAKKQVDRAVSYIYSNDPKLLLKALNYLHKAKELWNKKETIEGYVLALINISQLYCAIGMNLAAKYYALCGAWVCFNTVDDKLYKRISDSLGLLFYSDFKQGSWLNAISDFHNYINARHEFNPKPIDPEKDQLLFKTMADIAVILYATPKLSPQFVVLIETNIKALGYLSEDYLIPLLEKMEEDYPNEVSLKELIERKINDFPLNDAGKRRKISFNALGCLWEISFDNDYKINPIAEEFCAILQITLAEISLCEIDFHLVKSVIKIELELSEKLKQPEQLPSNTEYKWKVFVEYFESKDSAEINMHTARNATSLFYILNEISLLKDTDINELFRPLFEKNGLATKTLSVNSYQKMYRKIFTEEEFESLKRESFNAVECNYKLPTENIIMKWKSDLSEKYNKNLSIENIQGRYRNSLRSIHYTLERHKDSAEFQEYIREHRKEGWLDWQIILAVMNFIVNYKTKLELKKQEFNSEEEFVKTYQKIFDEYIHKDEMAFYVQFPIEAFKTRDFRFQLEQTPVYVLRSFGLENKSKFPNIKAVKEFLDIRFNMRNDNTDDGNPFIDIK
jgi:hypothetical protein